MDTKNLDAIKRMVARLQAIKETDWLVFDTVVRINTAKELLQQNTTTIHPPTRMFFAWLMV